MGENSTAISNLPPAVRLAQIAGVSVVYGAANAIGDFFTPAYGLYFVIAAAVISFAAVGYLVREDSLHKWYRENIGERLRKFIGPDLSEKWLDGKNRRWGIVLAVLSTITCAFTALKSHANESNGGLLASSFTSIANLQDKIGIREGMARQGLQWDGKTVREAFKNNDVEILESFLKGGWNIVGDVCCAADIASAFGDKSWSKRKPMFDMLARNKVDFISDWVNDDGQADSISPLESSIERGSVKSVTWVLAHGDLNNLKAYSHLREFYFRHGACLDDPALEERLKLAVDAGLPVNEDPDVYTHLYARWFAIKNGLNPWVLDDPANTARLAACWRHLAVVAPKNTAALKAAQAKAKIEAKSPKRNALVADKKCLEDALMEEWYDDMPIPRSKPPRDNEIVPVNCRGEYAYEMVLASGVRSAIKRTDGYIKELDEL